MSRFATQSISVQAAPTSLLGQIAAAMPSRSWVYMNGTTQNGVVCTRPTNFDTHFFHAASGSFQWGNRMLYNPVVGTIEAGGPDDGTHDGTGGGQWARYILNTNNCDSAYMLTSNGFNHLFELNTCNPFNGQNYIRKYGGTGVLSRWTSGAHPPFDTSMAACPHSWNIFAPTDWWRGTHTGGGAQGSLITVNQTSAFVDFYNPLTNSWFAASAIPGGIQNSYNFVGGYSMTKNVFVFGGSNNTPNAVWKVTSDRTCIRMSDAPVSLNLYDTSFIADPATGNYLVLTNGRQFYEFNPDGSSGTWTALPSVPNGGVLGTVNVNGNGANGVGAACVQDFGVVVYISSNFGGMQMHIYKHGV